MRSRAVLLLLLFLVVLLQSAGARADSGESCAGETPDTLRARGRWYVETFGVNGAFDPERRLEQVRASYADWLVERERRARRAALGLEVGAFRFLGPTNGAGRTPAIEPHPTDASIVYAGAAGGGCWKSTDGGGSWRALTDGLGDLSVGAVAIAPSSPSVVYLGTGEGGYAGDFVPGIGILRSTDGGETWLLPPFVAARFVYRLSVDPRDASTLVAFTAEGAQLSTDGGTSWRTTSDPAWGDGVDVARDPTNPDVLHATFWGLSFDETGTYARSTNAGRSWTAVAGGLPGNPKGRMSLASSANGRTLYTLIAGSSNSRSQVGLYRSTDGGGTWAAARLFDNASRATPDILQGQGGYDNTVAVDPDDASTLVLGGGALGMWRSTDGGDTVARIGVEDTVHVDIHQLRYKKYGAAKHLWSANDGGLWLSTDGGTRWAAKNTGLATRQDHAVALDATRANVHYGGTQDNGTDRTGDGGEAFERASGGDGFETAVDADSPAVVYTSGQFSTIFRSTGDGAPNSFGAVSQSFAGQAFSRSGGDRVKPFFTRLVLDPNDTRTLYTGTYRLWRSQDRGDTWAALGTSTLSADQALGALALSKSRPGRIVVAKGSALLLSNDGGETFVNLSGFPQAGAVLNVEIDPSDAESIWASSSFASATRPGGVYLSRNGGATWTRRASGLPDFAVPVVRVDPTDPATVYAGTLVGLYRSTDRGVSWARYGDGLPAVAVFDVRVAPDASRIVVATHGRGLWAAAVPGANRPPVVRIVSPGAPLAITAGSSISFTGEALDPDGDALSAYHWELGDGMTATSSATGAVVYRTPGFYRVSLVATDVRGARGAAFTSVTVRPPNDACADATPLAVVAETTVAARTGNGGAAELDARDPATCSDTGISNSIWFTVTAPANGSLKLDTFGSVGDTILALYDGSCEAPGAALACNDDANGFSGGPSELEAVNVAAGKTYRVLVASWSDPSRGFVGPIESVKLHARFSAEGGGQTAGTTAILPVVLDAFGNGGARFTSDLVLLNRGTAPITAALTYGGVLTLGGDATASVVIPAGTQLRVADALAELRRVGVSVPRVTPGSSQVGSLGLLVASGEPRSLVVASRVGTPNANAAVGGSFGTFTSGVAFEDTADSEAVYVYGLRQTERDRSNLALVHVRTPHAKGLVDSPIALSVEVFDASGRAANGGPIAVSLQTGEWTQIDGVLARAGLAPGAADGGYARVTRTAGTGRFAAYGVVNDQKTADGSVVPMTRAGRLRAADTLLVPIVLQAAGLGGSFFSSELVLASRSASSGSATLRYVGSPSIGASVSGAVTLPIAAGAQVVIPDALAFLRERGVAIPAGSSQGGPLFVTFDGLAAGDDVYAGVRTSTPNPDHAQGGSFGVFQSALEPAALATTSAVVPALRRDGTARANLAVLNGGASPITLSVSLRSAVDGSTVGTPLTRTLAAGEWVQWSNVFAQAGLADGEAWAIVTRTAGDAPWLAYGVLNDERTSDGSVVLAVR